LGRSMLKPPRALFALPLLCALLAGACSRAEPAPAPASPERLLSAVAASEASALAASGGRGKPAAERLAGPLARLDPARIDPHLAERFLSR
jgi:hypothetical protein